MSRTQEVLVPTATHPRLERSSWKVEAIRRGELKISGPLPISEGEGEDDAQTTKLHLDPPAAPPVPEPPISPKSPNALGIVSQPKPDEREITPVPDVAPQPQEESQPKAASIEQPPAKAEHRHTIADMAHSQSKPAPSLARSTTDSPASQLPTRGKRQSGLKNVFKRMFSRRVKRESRKDDASSPRHGYSQSDPGALTSTPKKASNVSHAAQASQSTPERPQTTIAPAEPRALEPVQEIQPKTTPRSHLPFPMNVNAPDETTPPSEVVEFDEKTPEIKKRRATLPSVVLNSAEISALAAIWSQSGTKVTAAEEQAFLSPSDSQIGIALSSPTQAVRSHRKSQSAGALRDLARQHNEPLPGPKTSKAPIRRRSAEIRYWRESIGARSFSVYSDLAPREDMDESEVSDKDVYESAADSPAEQKARAMGPSHIQGFNFGDLAAATSTTAPVRASARVDKTSQRSTSAQSEPTQQYAAPRNKTQTVIIADAPKEKRSSRQRSSSTVRENFSRPSSVREASAAAHAEAQKTPTPLPVHTPHTANPSFSSPRQDPDHVASEYTIDPDRDILPHEPATSRPFQPSTHDPDFPSPATQFHAIYTILRHERSARKALEKQVLSLNRDMAELRALNLKLIRNGGDGTYPTPSPDFLAGESADRAFEEDEGLGNSLGYEHVAAWQDGFVPHDRRRETAVSRFSKFDTEDEASQAEDVDEGEDGDAERVMQRASGLTHGTHATVESEGLVMKAPRTRTIGKSSQESSARSTDMGSPEVWETPLEEAHSAHSFGFGHPSARVVTPGQEEMF